MPGTSAFDAEYHRAFSGAIRLPSISQHIVWAPGMLGWLCEQYYGSAVFQSLDKSTRKTRRGILEAICERRIDGHCAGTFRYATMEPRHVAKLRDEKAGFPEAANHRLKALRQLFAWACLPEYRYASKNPARDVTYLKSNNPDGIPAWSEADAARYEARHPIGTKARLAFDLLLYTGVRRSDAVRLGPQMERDGKLVFTEKKGRSRIVKTHELPILPPLRRSIDATKKQNGHLVYLVAASSPNRRTPSAVGSSGGVGRPGWRAARMDCASSARSAAPKPAPLSIS
jgi:integrase